MSFGFCRINNAHGSVYNLCKWTCNHLKLKCMSEGRVACCACMNACNVRCSAWKEGDNLVRLGAKCISVCLFLHLSDINIKSLVTAGFAWVGDTWLTSD